MTARSDPHGYLAYLRSRRGSSAVFLCVILSALVSICFAFIYSTIEYTTASRADALMRLSGDSLLSEFDRDVLEEYGLFLLRAEDRELSSKLRQYLTYTFGPEEHVTVTDVKAGSGAFSLSDPAPAREQILSYMKSGGALKLKLTQENAADHTSAGDAGGRPLDSNAGRALRHGPTITSLPSRQLPRQDFLTGVQGLGEKLTAGGSIGSIFSDGTDQYLLSSYVLGMFNSTTRESNPEHFFYREVEYVLQGELTDQENARKTAASLRALRLPPNFAHIYADPQKQEALAAAAELITPGAAAVLTQAALAAAWAYAESVNDAALLMQGQRVPLVKDTASWAIDLESVLKDTVSGERDGVIRPEENKGLTYDQYLRMLLFLEDEDLITSRILDLIQINMRKNIDGRFLIGACSCGVIIDARINRRSYSYEKIYQRLLYR